MPAPQILIVDDEPFNLDYLTQELEDCGYSLSTAENGAQALAQVQAHPPDLILLDIMMPGMDGFTVLARLKADLVTRDIPVIIISASNDLPSVVKGIQLGAEDYLPKPFEPVLLQARIASCLEKKRLHDLQQLYLESLQRELEIGRQIQQGFLPAELPCLPGWELGAYIQAAREVAGDYYDAFLLPTGKLICLVGDVCGKGVGAALFMALFRSLLRAASTREALHAIEHASKLTPAQRLEQVVAFTNQYVADTHAEADMFTTLLIFLLTPDDDRVSYLNCGNEPAILLRAGSPFVSLPPTSPCLGVIPEAVFTARSLTLQPGDLLLAYTDGVTDAMNAASESFGRERLLASLNQIAAAEPAAIVNAVAARLLAFTAPAEQFDDITLFAIRKL